MGIIPRENQWIATSIKIPVRVESNFQKINNPLHSAGGNKLPKDSYTIKIKISFDGFHHSAPEDYGLLLTLPITAPFLITS